MDLKKFAIPLATLLGVMMTLAAAPALAADPPPTKLAVVSITRVFNALDAKKEGDAVVEAMGKKLGEERQAKIDARDKLQADLANYKPDSDVYKDTSEKLLKAALDAEAFPQYMQQRLLLETRVKTAYLYRLMNSAIADYAKVQGIALVLGIDDPDVGRATSMQDMVLAISNRKVIYAHDSLDITKAIIEKMNSENKAAPAK